MDDMIYIRAPFDRSGSLDDDDVKAIAAQHLRAATEIHRNPMIDIDLPEFEFIFTDEVKDEETGVDEELEAEFVERMKALYCETDREFSHGEGDRLLCELLEKLGYGAVVEAWRLIPWVVRMSTNTTDADFVDLLADNLLRTIQPGMTGMLLREGWSLKFVFLAVLTAACHWYRKGGLTKLDKVLDLFNEEEK